MTGEEVAAFAKVFLDAIDGYRNEAMRRTAKREGRCAHCVEPIDDVDAELHVHRECQFRDEGAHAEHENRLRAWRTEMTACRVTLLKLAHGPLQRRAPDDAAACAHRATKIAELLR